MMTDARIALQIVSAAKTAGVHARPNIELQIRGVREQIFRTSSLPFQ